jgi:uncharacterized protein YidB (DUF937 family)
MGLFDSIVEIRGGVMQRELGTRSSALGDVLGVVLQGNGGLGGLIERFRQGGLGNHADSWVGTGANLPLDASQLLSVLGDSQVAALAQRFGIDTGQLASHLAQALPGLVDHLTPGGQLPSEDSVASSLSALMGR